MKFDELKNAMKNNLGKSKTRITEILKREALRRYANLSIQCRYFDYDSYCDRLEENVASSVTEELLRIFRDFLRDVETEISRYLHRVGFPVCAMCKHSKRTEGLAHDEILCTKRGVIRADDDDACEDFEML